VTSPAVDLMQRLGLSDDELCEILAVDPIAVITGELDHRPELNILLDLTADAAEQVGDATLRRWARRRGPGGVPVEHLVKRDFAAFEDALDTLARRGFVLGGGAG
jgi:hypothetical protein